MALKKNQIHQGDCVKLLSKIDEGSVDLVFADPPFNIGYDYDVYDDKKQSEDYLDWCGQWIRGVHRALKPDGTFWLAIGDEYAAELKIESQKAGFHCRSWVIWYYTFGVHCANKFTRSHAHLFHFVKDPQQFVYNRQDIAVPSARQRIYNDARANPKGRSPDDTWILRPQECIDGFTPDEDVWYFPRVAGTFKERAGFHGCQMPEQLLGRIVRACSNEEDVVLDPFSGSATTLAVAKKLGRDFVGFELSKEYAALGTKRLDSITVGDSLDGSEEPKATNAKGKKKSKAKSEAKQLPGFPATDSIDEKLESESAGILDAFAKSNRGFSADRLVADPVLNADFQLACERLSLHGTEAERNRFLFRLRKAGKIKSAGINTTNRTVVDWPHLGRFIFASEIAWRRLSDKYCNFSLDEIFCDPRIATQFDEIASSFAPGFDAFDYRWAALKLRKEGMNARKRAALKSPKQFNIGELNKKKLQTKEGVLLSSLSSQDISNEPGVYIVRESSGDILYAGESEHLHSRLVNQFGGESQLSQWLSRDQNINIIYQVVDNILDYRLARQSILLKWHKPAWNHVKGIAA